jgi:hypothetical protein
LSRPFLESRTRYQIPVSLPCEPNVLVPKTLTESMQVKELAFIEKRVFVFPVPSQVPEFIDPVFTKTSPKPSFSVMENERFGLVFAKTGYINSGKDVTNQTLPGQEYSN